ncbi:hypothetical protein LOK49_LG08G00787 [Camellia lanceoleosa]|uniref:Uncharacterized protein n=1 Tax=Camellia lanceoleosa TaxID=1840588 RepID=A0ACC0GQT1_9ERIC|nr:hypothetical protein LOK49_LG08G00787 [Camellia lanceoleosa]
MSNSLAHSLSSNGNKVIDRSPEEEDHLERSTKKIKGTTAEHDDQEMKERSAKLDAQPMEEETKLPEASTTKSFKQALTETKNNEKAFDNDLDRLSSNDDFLTDEENNGAESDEEQESGFNPNIPKIKLPPRLIASIHKPWKDCLIVRLLGKTVGFKILVHRLKKLWGLQGDFEATNLGLGFFLIKFEMLANCNRVYTEGPWIIMDHYLTVRRWEHDFMPSEAKEVTTALMLPKSVQSRAQRLVQQDQTHI